MNRFVSWATIALMATSSVGARATDPVRIDETITIFNNVLWIAGVRVIGPQIRLRFDGQRFFVGRAELPLHIKPRVIPDENYERSYGQAPRVSGLVAAGYPIREAAEVFEQEVESVLDNASERFDTFGMDSACAIVRSSPFVANTTCENTSIRFNLQGILGFRVVDFTRYSPKRNNVEYEYHPADRVIELVNYMKQCVTRERMVPAVLFVGSGGGTLFVTGAEAAKAEAQVAHLRSGRTFDNFPEGPFVPSDVFLVDFVPTEAEKWR